MSDDPDFEYLIIDSIVFRAHRTLPAALPKARSPSSLTTRHARSNIRSTSIFIPSAISWNAASQSSALPPRRSSLL
jgi:hypothetical protein